MTYENIIYKVEDGIATLSLNRPDSYNAVNAAMVYELMDACDKISNDSKVRVVILKGEGKAFCAGGDVKEMQETKDRNLHDTIAYVRLFNSMAVKLINLPKPVVTSIQGVAVGAGCNLAFAGDIIVASKKAKFSEIFSNIGLIPDAGGTYLLPRLIGRAKAKEHVFLHTMIGADEALQLGIVNRVVEPEELEAEVMNLAQELAKGPTLAYAAAKQLINKSFETNLVDALEDEAYLQSITFMTEDYAEGRDAFLEKRSANYKGK